MAKIMLTILYLRRDAVQAVSGDLCGGASTEIETLAILGALSMCVACCMGDRSCLGNRIGSIDFFRRQIFKTDLGEWQKSC